METNETEATERTWLAAVCERLGDGDALPAPSDADVRMLLRVTKITAEVTGVRYLAPLTSYLIGMAAARAGEGFDLRRAVDAIAAIAEGWPAPPPPTGDRPR